jgi:hypothetical protein
MGARVCLCASIVFRVGTVLRKGGTCVRAFCLFFEISLEEEVYVCLCPYFPKKGVCVCVCMQLIGMLVGGCSGSTIRKVLHD